MRVGRPDEQDRRGDAHLVADETPQCEGCGTTTPPLHELTTGIFACDQCMEATMEAMARTRKTASEGGPDLHCHSD
jgi:ribosomal protein L37AE/L43A